MEKLIDQALPIFDIEHGCIISKQGDMTLAFELTLPEIFSLSQQQYEILHQRWVKAIKILPAGSICHKQDWFLEKKFNPGSESPQQSFLSQSSDRFFSGRPYLDHTCYVMLTKKAASRKPASSLASNLISGSPFPSELLDEQALHDFSDSASQFKRILVDSGLCQMRQLTDQELWSSRSQSGLIERYAYLQAGEKARLIRDIEFKDGLRVGDRHCQLYSLADLQDMPSQCGPWERYEKYSSTGSDFITGFASCLGLLLDCNHILNQYVLIEDTAATLKKLESKRLRLQSLSLHARENALALEATNDFLNEAISQQRLPVKAHFNVLAWTENKNHLKDLKSKVSSALAQLDAVAKVETVGAPQLFWAGIPGNQADLPLNETLDTFAEQAACFLNMETSYRSSPSPVGLRLGDRLTGKPVQVDLSDEPIELGICTNRNKFIIGPSGSGKSFFTNHLVRSYYETGAHIVLVDVGHSYKGLCELVGGYYFTYSEKTPLCFNPFHLSSGQTLDTEKKESIKTLLVALWKKDDERYKRSEYVALSNSLSAFYEHLERHPNLFPCFDSFYVFLRDEFGQQIDADGVKESDFDLHNFLYVLRPYYRGGDYDYLLNATQNLDLLNERFIVFELDAIQNHPVLFPVVTLIIMEVFISKMRRLIGIRKLILIEEAWKAIAKEGMAQYVQYVFKTVRKFFGEAIVVTQEIEDIISSPVVKQAIINNSDCKILLDQSKYQNKFEDIQKLLGLTENEKAQTLSVNKANDPLRKYKEVFISLAGAVSRVYRTEVSLEEYLCYTTEQTEKLKVEQFARQYGSVQKGIAVLAAQMRQNR